MRISKCDIINYMKFKSKFVFFSLLVVLFPGIIAFAVYMIVDHYNGRAVVFAAVSAVISMTVSMEAIYHFWIKPINKLNEAIKRVSQGDLDFAVRSEDKGEISRMIDDFEEMRARLKESLDERLKDEKENRELISNISHDLKTPITAIRGYVEGIMDGVADSPEKMDKYIKTIYNKTNEMTYLINELTIYSQIDANRIPYNFHRLNVKEYFSDCADDIGLELDEKGIEFKYSNNVRDDVLIIADPEQLRRVVNNIVGNSVKYMERDNGSISITVTDISDSVRIEITDNGKGISQEDLPNIFDRFYRADSSRNSAKGGSGIGLSIVKKIIEDHGGYIWATSEENKGTTMHFVLRKYSKIEEPKNDILNEVKNL